jgi:putative NADH-flavin reductase
MQLTIFGSTGGTGQRLISQAIADGHHVVASVRRPEALDEAHERLRVVRGDILDRASLQVAVTGADAVISVIGIGYRRHATVVYSAGTANIMTAMREAGVRRLLCVSTAGLVIPADGTRLQRLVFRHVLHRLLRKPYDDMSRMEGSVRGSDLDWTIVRAARLTNGPGRGHYRTAVHGSVHGGWSISRSDLAGYLLSHVNDPSCYRATVELAY